MLTKEVLGKGAVTLSSGLRGVGAGGGGGWWVFVIVNSKAFVFVCLFVKQPPSLLEGEKNWGYRHVNTCSSI